MSRKTGWAVVVVCIASLATAGPKGTVPRSSVDRYAAHTLRDGIGIGVVVLFVGTGAERVRLGCEPVLRGGGDCFVSAEG